VTWAPFVFALVLGLAIAGALFAGYVWPDAEPERESEPKSEPE
jgi:hypothetical protein